MSDLRISQLPALTSIADTDVAAISQLTGSPTTRRATFAQLRSAVHDGRSVHVRDFGAVGNGITDDAPAIQAAINSLAGNGGGTVMFAAKTYRLASAITISNATVHLRGQGFTEGGGPGDGTWLRVDSTSFTPITFTGSSRGSKVSDIAFTQQHSGTFNAGWAPTNYDWFIKVVDCLGGVDFDNIFFAAVNKGIYCYNSGRTDFRRIRGQVFTCGIEMDQALDVPRYHNIHFWPFWSADTNVLRWQQDNGDALVFKRVDGPFIDQAFGFGYRSLFRFTQGSQGYTTKFYIGQAYADFIRYGILIDTAGVDGLIANYTCQSERWNASGAPCTDSAGLLISAQNCKVQIGNMRVDTVEDSAIRIGAFNNRVDVFALRCVNYNTRNNGSAAINVANASSGGVNRVHLGTPPVLEGTYAGILQNGGTNGVVQMRAPAGGTPVPGLAVGQDNTGLSAPTGTSMALSANGAEIARVAQSGTVTLGGASPNHALEVTTPAGTVNRLRVQGGASGVPATLLSEGSDGNVGLVVQTKGSGTLSLQTGEGAQAQVLSQGGSVNVMQLVGGATGAPGRVGWQAAGSDANINAVIGQPKGSGAVLAQFPDNAVTGGAARGTYATDLQTDRNNAVQVASGDASAVLGGRRNLASGSESVVAGGYSNVSSGVRASILGGSNNTATDQRSTIGGGHNNTSGGAYSWVPGGNSSNTRNQVGKGAWASGMILAQGDAQAAEHVLFRQTTDATTTRLTAGGAAQGTTNSLNLPDFGVCSGRLTVIAKAAGGTAAAKWLVDLSAVRGSGGSTVVVFEGATASLAPTASSGTGSAWRLTIAADTSNGGIAVSGTGAAGTTINWVARYASVEVVTAS
jgi:hypothetical protein